LRLHVVQLIFLLAKMNRKKPEQSLRDITPSPKGGII
jgi:hypothetical protein